MFIFKHTGVIYNILVNGYNRHQRFIHSVGGYIFKIYFEIFKIIEKISLYIRGCICEAIGVIIVHH